MQFIETSNAKIYVFVYIFFFKFSGAMIPYKHSNDSNQCPILTADFVIFCYGIENGQAIQAGAGSEWGIERGCPLSIPYSSQMRVWDTDVTHCCATGSPKSKWHIY